MSLLLNVRFSFGGRRHGSDDMNAVKVQSPELGERADLSLTPSTPGMQRIHSSVGALRATTRAVPPYTSSACAVCPRLSRAASQKSWDDDYYDREPPRPPKNKFQKQQANIRSPPPPPTAAELEIRAKRRIQRAERLERKDLTAQMTETKTCE